MFEALGIDFPGRSLAIVFVTVMIAGLIGYLLARQQYREMLKRQSGIITSEMARLRRRAASAEQTTQRMRTEVERYRRASRH